MKCPICDCKKSVWEGFVLKCEKCGYIFKDREKTRFFMRERRVLIICSFSLMFIMFVTFFFFVIPINYKNEVIYKGIFTEKEKSIVENIINDLKPEYFSKIKQIKIINPNYKNDWVGINWNGFVTIEYENNLDNLKDTICHEILHSIVNAVNDEEFIVGDIAKTNVCFKEEKNE